jgi:CHAD domain-containing protein
MAYAKTEFELKLTGAAADCAALRGMPLISDAACGPASWERLVSVYFDTPDFALAAAGISLRHRNDPDGMVLTAKLTPPGGSSVSRLESERAITRGDDFFTGVAAIDAVIAPLTEKLVAIAQTQTDRWSRLVQGGGAIIEVSAETGQSVRYDADRTRRLAPVAEVELELLKGDPAAVFHLARRITAAADGRLRPDIEPKLQRALRAGAVSPIGKSPRPVLKGDPTAGDVLAGGLFACAARLIECAPHFIDLRDPDSARHLRVVFRRLRALERAFRPATKKSGLRKLAAEARDYGRMIGEARDLDVFLSDTLPKAREMDAAPPQALARFRAEIDARRATAWEAAVAALSGKEFARFQLELLESAVLTPWRAPGDARLASPAREFARAVLDRGLRRAQQRADGLEFSDAASLHVLRLDLKKLRYSAQTFRDVYPAADRKPYFKAMSALQAAFGELNDAVVAQNIVDGAAAGKGADSARIAGFIAGYHCAKASSASKDIEARWRSFAVMAPYWRKIEEPHAEDQDHPLS